MKSHILRVMEVTDTTCDSMTLSPVGLAMAVASYRQLIAWQKGISLVTDLYRLTNSFPRDEIYRLTSQMRRAAVSIPANIAEGQGRLSTGEFKQFLGHARGSMFELESHTVIAHNLGYLTQEDSGKVVERIHELGRLVNGLLKSLDRTAS